MELKITPSGQTIVKPTALGPVANTDTKLLIYGLFQKGRVLAQDEDQQAKATRDPVAPAKRSEAALRKIQTKKLDDGSRDSSFRTLLGLLTNIVRNKCRRPEAGPDEPTFDVTTTPDSKQQRAYDLLKGITV